MNTNELKSIYIMDINQWTFHKWTDSEWIILNTSNVIWSAGEYIMNKWLFWFHAACWASYWSMYLTYLYICMKWQKMQISCLFCIFINDIFILIKLSDSWSGRYTELETDMLLDWPYSPLYVNHSYDIFFIASVHFSVFVVCFFSTRSLFGCFSVVLYSNNFINVF